jgi:hypothetical protein
MSDNQFKNLKLWLDEKFKAIDRRFDENDKGHQRIIDRQDIANGGLRKNTEFRVKNEDEVGHNTKFRLKFMGGWTMVKIMFGTSILSNLYIAYQFLSSK